MAYLGMAAFIFLFCGVIVLSRRFLTPKRSQDTVDVAALWRKLDKHIIEQSNIDQGIIEQAIRLQALDLQGSFETNQHKKHDIYSEYYCGCRLLILSLLPQDGEAMAKGLQRNVVSFADHAFKKT